MNPIENIIAEIIIVTERGTEREWKPQIHILLNEYTEGLAQRVLAEIKSSQNEDEFGFGFGLRHAAALIRSNIIDSKE